MSTQTNYHIEYREELLKLAQSQSDVLILDNCAEFQGDMDKRCHYATVYEYPEIMQVGFMSFVECSGLIITFVNYSPNVIQITHAHMFKHTHLLYMYNMQCTASLTDS